MADKDYWSQLSSNDKAKYTKEGYTKDSFNRQMKKLMESSESNRRLDGQDPGAVVPKPKPRPRTRSTTVEAKKGGLFTRKGPCK